MEAFLAACTLTPQLLFWFSVAAGVIHTIEELGCDGGPQPIWKYLGITDDALLGTVLLTGFLGLQSWLALAGHFSGHYVALVALLAIRLLDFGVSHLGPWLAGKRPNPGIITSPLYLLDALLIGAVLSRL